MRNLIIKFHLFFIGISFIAMVLSCVKKNNAHKAVVHTVSFDTDNGTPKVETQEIENHKKVIDPNKPSKEGFRLKEWINTANSETYDFSELLTDDLNLKAIYEVVYTIVFDSNGGSAIAQAISDKGSLVNKPADPTRADYKFGGWFLDEAFSTEFDFGMHIDSHFRLFAKWSPLKDILDDIFRAELKGVVPNAFVEEQLQIDHTDVLGLEVLDFAKKSISSLDDIQYFTALKELNCSFNDLIILDISKNTHLEKLNCRTNSLKSLDVSNNYALTQMRCYQNPHLTNLNMHTNLNVLVLDETDLQASNRSILTISVPENNLKCSLMSVEKSEEIPAFNFSDNKLSWQIKADIYDLNKTLSDTSDWSYFSSCFY